MSKIPKVEDYSKYTDVEHVLHLPSMYIGSLQKLTRDEWLFDSETKTIRLQEIDLVPGCEKVFLEILSNASDHCGKSRREGSVADKIEITMTEKIITIKNFGLPVPIEKTSSGEWLPEQIFGTLRSSSHYKEESRQDAGCFGIGGKAANIFSTHFAVTIENAVLGKKYTQIWQSNMSVCNPPKIVVFKGKTSSVSIEYHLDFERFGYIEYPQEAFELFGRHAIDTSFTSKVTVVFNKEIFKYTDIRDYGSLYFGDVSKSIVYKNDNLELLICDTPDVGTHVSFVNSLMTKEGGTHVNYVYKVIGEPIVSIINESIEKKLDKSGLDAKAKKAHLISVKDVKPHISILLSCKLRDPEYNGNAKSYLTKPTPKFDIDVKILESMLDWELVHRLNEALTAKHAFNMSKTDGKMSLNVHIDIENFHDASHAGSKKSHLCILCPTEGKSGSSYIRRMMSTIPDGSSFYGVLPLKGKCLNVLTATDTQLEMNKEINAFKIVLGLKENTDYTDPNNFKKLRYGKIMICADSDVDGKHIVGLILNIIRNRFPSLLKIENFVNYKRTPILRLTKGKKVDKFYTQREYDVWLQKKKDLGEDKGWSAKYYKGLATSTKDDIIDDNKDVKIVTCIYDDKADAALKLAFDPKFREERKQWILNYVPRDDVDSLIKQPISLFINHELILFSKYDNSRSIPSMLDGLKVSHRKIIAGAHKKFHIGILNKDYHEMKVANLDAYISNEMNYHHGTDILSKAIILMAQDFIGSNNINFFEPRGEFGTRLDNGRDFGASRYIYTVPAPMMPYIYAQDDQALLIPQIDEGMSIEPETYLPIIPTILVNGASGIGSGFSTFIPCHNPLTILEWLKNRLMGKISLPTITPWYRGFTGDIVVIDRKKPTPDLKINAGVDLENEDIDIEEDDNYDDAIIDNKPLFSYVATGIYHVEKNGHIIITELPIGRSPSTYLNKYVKKMLNLKIIKKYHDKSDTEKIHFELIGFTGETNYQNLGLRKRYSLSNMVLLDKKGIPVKFDTANDIMEAFYIERLPYFEKRKTSKLGSLQVDIDKLNHEISFINAILNKDLIVQNVSKQMIYEKLKLLKIPESIYNSAKLSDISKEEIILLNNKIDHLKKEYNQLAKLSGADLWLADLKLFEQKYKSIYKN